jgi:transcriptional regulator GlxA family with amidase domain
MQNLQQRRAWLLQRTQHSIAEVAVLTGFADGAHFSREFRKRRGLSPSQWRRATLPAEGERKGNDPKALVDGRVF